MAASPIAVRRCGSLAAGARAERPTAFDVQEKTIAELQAALTSGAVTSRSLVLAYLARIRAYDLQGPRLNAMIAMNRKVLEIADALDRERAARAPARPAARDSDRRQGQLRDRRPCRPPADRWR